MAQEDPYFSGTPGGGAFNDFTGTWDTGGGGNAAPQAQGSGAWPAVPGTSSAIPSSPAFDFRSLIPGFNPGGDPNAAMSAAMLAGLFEKPNNPLIGPIVQGVQGAIGAGQNIQGLQIPGITPSFQSAIDLAGKNAGAWAPDLSTAQGFTTAGGTPMTSEDISRYFNPYVEQALNPAARKINEVAALQQQMDAAKSMSRGAFGTDRQTQIEELNKRNQLMSLGDLYGTGFGHAFDTAVGASAADRARQLQAAGISGDIATKRGALGTQDISNLATAGGIEALPFSEGLSKQKTAGDVLSGAAAAGARAIGSTGRPSLLTNLAGVGGILGAGKKTGVTPNAPGGVGIPGIPGIGGIGTGTGGVDQFGNPVGSNERLISTGPGTSGGGEDFGMTGNEGGTIGDTGAGTDFGLTGNEAGAGTIGGTGASTDFGLTGTEGGAEGIGGAGLLEGGGAAAGIYGGAKALQSFLTTPSHGIGESAPGTRALLSGDLAGASAAGADLKIQDGPLAGRSIRSLTADDVLPLVNSSNAYFLPQLAQYGLPQAVIDEVTRRLHG